MTETTAQGPDDQNPYSPPADQKLVPEVRISALQWVGTLLLAAFSAVGAFLITCIGSGFLVFEFVPLHPSPSADFYERVEFRRVMFLFPWIIGGLAAIFTAIRVIRNRTHTIRSAADQHRVTPD
ncbi:MAG: hypothetical protein KDA85_06715 [Planctomycetaceae bacterium]|nr:hypothetical protein [Planctomycetaceae bacterium]